MIDAITHAVGNPLAVPVLVLLLVGLFFTVGLDITNVTISVLTLLLLPVLQGSQNRDGAALQAKLDELIKASDARNDFVGIDRKPQQEIERLRDD